MKRFIYRLLTNILQKKNIYLIKGLSYLGCRPFIPYNHLDYVRVATLELLAYEIIKKNVPGSVVELGVYRGAFAKYLNQGFSNRTLYLFDTFSGFDEKDMATEKVINPNLQHQDFSATSVQEMLDLLPYPQNCVVKMGTFPDTFKGMEGEHFALVSLDADLYAPTLAGLELFYQRLSKGGYIMVHDFNNALYEGCRKAVEEFCTKMNLSYTPISDIGGSVILAKT
jgi:O-methyltransferase